MQNYPVYDAVLLPPPNIAQAAASLSQSLAPLGTLFTLGQFSALPHLSLYMANLSPDGAANVLDALNHTVQHLAPFQLIAERYGKNEFGMVEVFYQKPQELINLQQTIVQVINPQRNGMIRMQDPVGRSLQEYVPTTSGEIRSNFEQYGYDEIGAYFRPHITLTRLHDPNTPLDFASLPPVTNFNGTFDTIALCLMGQNGTCTFAITQFKLGAQPKLPAPDTPENPDFITTPPAPEQPLQTQGQQPPAGPASFPTQPTSIPQA